MVTTQFPQVISAPMCHDCLCSIILGGSGFLGSHLAQRLIAAGQKVTILDKNPPPIDDDNIVWIQKNTEEFLQSDSNFSGYDYVYFLGGYTRPSTKIGNMSSVINAEVSHVVDLAQKFGQFDTKGFIFASSGGTVYGHSEVETLSEDSRQVPINAYGASKLASEHFLRLLCQSTSMAITSLRISNLYGPGQRVNKRQGVVAAILSAMFNDQAFTLIGDGMIIRDYIYISDVAAAFHQAQAFSDGYEVINIGTGKGNSVFNLIHEIERQTGKKLKITPHEGNLCDVDINVLNISKAKEILGWEPTISLPVGLQKTIETYQ